MLSKNKLKFIKSLEKKKARTETNCFVAEGNKLVDELIGSFDCELLIGTASWFDRHPQPKASESLIVSREEIDKASFQKNPQEVIAIFKQPVYELDLNAIRDELVLVLDGVQDPGNLGTIVRIADWFGIKDIICSPDTADIYNPKVVQATMGGMAHVRVHYRELTSFLSFFQDKPIYGTFLDGENMYAQSLATSGLIIMGNEGNGIRKEIEQLVNHKLYIPNYPPHTESTESLNVAVATAIVCAEFRRSQVYTVDRK